jgi:hypothetical protein
MDDCELDLIKYFLPYLLFEANLGTSRYLNTWSGMLNEVCGGHACDDYAIDVFQELGYSSDSQKLTVPVLCEESSQDPPLSRMDQRQAHV